MSRGVDLIAAQACGALPRSTSASDDSSGMLFAERRHEELACRQRLASRTPSSRPTCRPTGKISRSGRIDDDRFDAVVNHPRFFHEDDPLAVTL